MKIAYIILAHKLPEQLVRLVRKLNTDMASFFIHVDKKTDGETYRKMTEPLSEYENVYFLDRYARYYGDFNHVKPTLDGIQKILALGKRYDYIILMTGQHYPIKSNSQIQKALQDSGGQSFVEYFSLPDERWKDGNGGLDRINYWHLHWRGWEFAFLKRRHFLKRVPDRVWSALVKILPMRRNLPRNFKEYGGSAYWCLTRECAEYIDEFVRRNDDFVKFFKHVKIAEEIFFQTILMNSHLKNRLTNDNLRYIIWPPSSRHPAILGKQDFENFIKTDKLFARKFDMTVDADVLDMIDRATS